MTQELLNIVVLHNISSVKEDEGIKIFYPYQQDIEIIRSIKKLPYNVSSKLYDGDLSDLKDVLVVNICDAFSNPEDELNLIKNLEKNKLAYTGCGYETVKNCQNKFFAKKIFEESKIKTPLSRLFKNENESLGELKFPLILKLNNEDASIGLDEDSVVFNEEEQRKKLSQLFLKYNKEVLAEEYVEGREFNVPIIGNENPEALNVLEIDYSKEFENKPKILTYKAKWSKNSNDFKNTYSNIAKIEDNEKEKIISAAIKAYKALKCTGYASVDVRMNDKNELFVIEINANCYIAPESDILKAALSQGISYEELLGKVINYAAERFALNKDLIIME